MSSFGPIIEIKDLQIVNPSPTPCLYYQLETYEKGYKLNNFYWINVGIPTPVSIIWNLRIF